MLKEFKDFIMRGNVLDLAVALIMGLAFGKIVTSLVNDIIMPPLGLILGRVDFANLLINLSDKAVKSVAEAKALGVPTINYGIFINNIIEFLIVSFVLFLIVRQANRVMDKMGVSDRGRAKGHDDDELKDAVKDHLKEGSRGGEGGKSAGSPMAEPEGPASAERE